MTVVGNQARMGGSERFWASEYDAGSGLSKKVVIWLEVGDKGCSLVLALIVVENGEKGWARGQECIDGGGVG